MNKKNIIILICAIFVFIVAFIIFWVTKSYNLGNVVNNSINNTNEPSHNSKIDNFYFYDNNQNILTLDDFSDKPIAILFWRSDTENILDLIDLFEKHYNEYVDQINFLIINTNEPDLSIEEHVKNANFIMPIYFDKDNTANKTYSFEKLPHMVFIEKDGTISNEVKENITEDSLLANLDLIAHNY